ncbi:L,D-transpeptidase family protein [Candidatus Nomurabacteria bacterium]|nr:L,D-transpeptidase family protein [Candidatus Nomurabacteria bacterium]
MKAIIFSFFLFVFWMPPLVLASDQGCLYNECDSDNDGLTNAQEINIYFSDPYLADTDGDGYSDGEEVASSTSPLNIEDKKNIDLDTDQDGLNDAWELILGTNLNKADTDGDGYSDGEEVNNSYDPLSVLPIQRDKLIKVDLATQTLEYYFNQKLLDSFLISGGLPRTPTVKGEFTVLDKIPVKRYVGAGYDLPNTKWNLLFTRRTLGYYIHGAYWHDNFGQPMSHGCVNVAYKDMERLYDWAQVGTKIEIQ